ncbi:aldose epimerase family protein [Flavobacterium plurextorum]|uniref:aldose epimerase family protein n=1 Tax=Flavobacterium plurextorum TaxID=1114867 RepID=UPI003756EA72
MKTINKSHSKETSSADFSDFGPEIEKIRSFELSNKNGMKVEILNYGATVSSLQIPISEGEIVDVVLGFDSPKSYLESYNLPSAPYFGTTVGRYAGRIHKGLFSLNGKTYQLTKNNNRNSLHGGNIGFGKKIWNVTSQTSNENPSITFSLLSEDLDENYPGELQVDLTYTLTEDNELKLNYKAISTEDTVINLTHHSYFNLDGHDGSVLDQKVFIAAEKMLETDQENIPTGKFIDLNNHKFDFRSEKKCPASIDNSFVINQTNNPSASLFSSKNNLKMSVYTNQPSVHIYVGGNCFDILKGKNEAVYHKTSGICFETQNFPDAPNQAHFPNSVLRKGEIYNQETVYKFEILN